MKRIITLLFTSTVFSFAQDLTKDTTNTYGERIDSAEERLAFLTALGIPNVENTADIDKPISMLTQAALDLKADTSSLSAYLLLSGGSLSGNLSLGGNGMFNTTRIAGAADGSFTTSLDMGAGSFLFNGTTAGSLLSVAETEIKTYIPLVRNSDSSLYTTESDVSSLYLPLAGGTMTGALNMGGFAISSADNIDAATYTSGNGDSAYFPSGLNVASSSNFNGNFLSNATLPISTYGEHSGGYDSLFNNTNGRFFDSSGFANTANVAGDATTAGNARSNQIFDAPYGFTSYGNAAYFPYGLTSVGNTVATLEGSEVISGTKDFTGALTVADQDITDPTAAVNMNSVNRLKHFSVNAFTSAAPYLITTPTGGSATQTTQYTYVGTATDITSIGKLDIMDYALGAGGTGDTWNFSVPFILSGRSVVSIANEYANVRIQAGLNGSETIPLKGSDPIPTEERGIGIEFRKDPSGSDLQVRLYARDGYPTVSGTFIASAWVNLVANSYAYTVSYVIEHIPSTSTVNLYLKADVANSIYRATKISETPVLTISGAGVPNNYHYVASNKFSILGLVVPDGVNSPAYSNLTSWNHNFEIK